MIDLPTIATKLEWTWFPKATIEQVGLPKERYPLGAYLEWPQLQYGPELWVQWPGVSNDNGRPWEWGN